MMFNIAVTEWLWFWGNDHRHGRPRCGSLEDKMRWAGRVLRITHMDAEVSQE